MVLRCAVAIGLASCLAAAFGRGSASLPEKSALSTVAAVKSADAAGKLLSDAEKAAADLNPDGIAAAVHGLESRSSTSLTLAKALMIQADFARNEAGDVFHALKTYRDIVSRWPASILCAQARIQINDIAWENRFEAAVKDDESVLQKFPNLPKPSRELALRDIALFSYQTGNSEKARDAFQRLLASDPSDENARLAKRYLYAIDHPKSVDGATVLFEKGSRWLDEPRTRSLADKCFREFEHRMRSPGMSGYVTSAAVLLRDRAEMRYRLALARWELGDHNKSAAICSQISDDPALNPETIMRSDYLMAYHHAHCGHFKMAEKAYRELIDKHPEFSETTPSAYKELAGSYFRDRNYLESALTAEEFLILYPYHVECRFLEAAKSRALATGGAGVVSEFQKRSQALKEKLKARSPVRLVNSLDTFKQEKPALDIAEGNRK